MQNLLQSYKCLALLYLLAYTRGFDCLFHTSSAAFVHPTSISLHITAYKPPSSSGTAGPPATGVRSCSTWSFQHGYYYSLSVSEDWLELVFSLTRTSQSGEHNLLPSQNSLNE